MGIGGIGGIGQARRLETTGLEDLDLDTGEVTGGVSFSLIEFKSDFHASILPRVQNGPKNRSTDSSNERPLLTGEAYPRSERSACPGVPLDVVGHDFFACFFGGKK